MKSMPTRDNISVSLDANGYLKFLSRRLLTYFEDVIMSISGSSVGTSVILMAIRSHGTANGRVHLTKNGHWEWKDSSIKSALLPSSGLM